MGRVRLCRVAGNTACVIPYGKRHPVVLLFYPEKNSPNVLLCFCDLCQCWLYTVADKDKDGKKPAAAAGTMATTTPVVTSRQPAVDVSKWTTSDVQTWLKKNNIQHLQKWYKTVTMLH